MNIKLSLLASSTLLLSSHMALAQNTMNPQDGSNGITSTTTLSTTTSTTTDMNTQNMAQPIQPTSSQMNTDPNYYADDDYYHNNPNKLARALITKNATADSYYNRYTFDKPKTREQVNEELATWEKAGYDPSRNDPYYPNDAHVAQVRISMWQAKYGSSGQVYQVAQPAQ